MKQKQQRGNHWILWLVLEYLDLLKDIASLYSGKLTETDSKVGLERK